jgi:hypothetical protein
MNYKINENGSVRNATPEETAEINERKAAAAQAQPAPAPTKEQLMAELAALTAKIQALE